jgi:hypothetical protein
VAHVAVLANVTNPVGLAQALSEAPATILDGLLTGGPSEAGLLGFNGLIGIGLFVRNAIAAAIDPPLPSWLSWLAPAAATPSTTAKTVTPSVTPPAAGASTLVTSPTPTTNTPTVLTTSGTNASPTTTHSSRLSATVKTVTAQLNSTVKTVANTGKKTPTANADGGGK